MRRSSVVLQFLLPAVLLLGLGGCATNQKWAASGGNKEQGVVRVSYEYPEFRQPSMSDTEADELALSRCHAWGFSKAEPIAGQIRQCANVDDGNCKLWSVTREYQCSDGQARVASRLSR